MVGSSRIIILKSEKKTLGTYILLKQLSQLYFTLVKARAIAIKKQN